MNLRLIIFALLTASLRIVTGSEASSQYTEGSSWGGTDGINSIHITGDKGYIFAGYTNSIDGNVKGFHGGHGYDCWIVKLDSTGKIQWQLTLGGTKSDEANAVKPTTDGGYVVVGRTMSNDGDVSQNYGQADAWIIKLDDMGAMQWQKSFGSSGDDTFNDVIAGVDGTYLVVGNTNAQEILTPDRPKSKGWFIKLTSTGNIMWEKKLSENDCNSIASIKNTYDNNYSLFGHISYITGSGLPNDPKRPTGQLVKIDIHGNRKQDILLGNEDVFITASKPTTDGGYAVTGRSVDSNSGNRIRQIGYVAKLDSMGNIKWKKTYGGSNGQNAFMTVTNCVGGGYIVGGFTNSNDGDAMGGHGASDGWLIKMNDSGDKEWHKSIGGSNHEFLKIVESTSDKGFVVALNTTSNDGDVTFFHGQRGSDCWIVKLDHLGQIQWQRALGGGK